MERVRLTGITMTYELRCIHALFFFSIVTSRFIKKIERFQASRAPYVYTRIETLAFLRKVRRII